MVIGLRTDFDAPIKRAVAKRSKDGAQARRHFALAAIQDGMTWTPARGRRDAVDRPWLGQNGA